MSSRMLNDLLSSNGVEVPAGVEVWCLVPADGVGFEVRASMPDDAMRGYTYSQSEREPTDDRAGFIGRVVLKAFMERL